MKTNLLLIGTILVIATSSSFALTPKERDLVLQIKAKLEAVQREQQHSKDLADWAKQSNQEAWDYALETGKAAQTAKKEAQAQANEVAKMKPVYDECTKWFGLGAIWFGIKKLTKNLLVLGLVISVLSAALYGLKWAFPAIGPAIGIVVGAIKLVVKKIVSMIGAVLKKIRNLIPKR